MNNSQIKLTALSVPDLVKLLKRFGSRSVSEETVREDIANGAPANPDGTVNLIFYTAWQVKEASENSDLSVKIEAGGYYPAPEFHPAGAGDRRPAVAAAPGTRWVPHFR